MSGFLKGDTFIEVASALARADLTDAVSFDGALESVKRYVRAKIKKGKGKEVAGPGGKLEQLEVKYAHLGFQDVFYLTRLQLSLPPSALTLPRPTSPTRKQLVKARYPLSPEYQISIEDPRASMSDASSVITSSTSVRRVVSRGRDNSVKGLGRVASTAPTLSTPDLGPLDFTSSPSTLPVRTPAPPSPAVLIPLRDHDARDGLDSRDHFDFIANTHAPVLPPLHLPEPAHPVRNGLAPISSQMRRMASGSSQGSSNSGQRAQRGSGAATGDEGDVKRMLEARIKALQSALTSLEVDQALPIPTSVSMSRPASNSSSIRRDLPAPSSPPKAPLPPTPSQQQHDYFSPPGRRAPPPERLRVQNPSTPTSAIPSPTLARGSSISKRHFPPSPMSPTNTSPRSTFSSGTMPSSPSLMFDLDPELAMDPFAPSSGAAGVSRYEREAAAYARAREDLRRVKLSLGEGRETPPPRYEAGMHGRAL